MSQSNIKTGIDETQIRDKGQQLADLLRPNTFGLYNANPRTLSEWLIYIIAWPIFAPLTWVLEMARWLMVATRFTIWHILGMIGMGNVAPLMDLICENLGPQNPLYPLFDMLRDPDSEFGASIIDNAVGGAVAMGVNRVLDPLMRPVGYATETLLMNNELPENVYVSGVRKGVIAWENFIQGMQRYGYNPEMSDKLFRSLKLAPGVMETLDMLNRGYIDQATCDTYLLMNDFTADINANLKNLRWYVLSASDVTMFASNYVYHSALASKFGLYTDFPESMMADASRQGIKVEDAKKFWANHWGAPSNNDMFSMLHRGIIDEGTLNEGLYYNNIPPFWRDPMKQAAHSLVTQRYIRNLIKYGIWDYNQVFAAYKKMGFDDDNARSMSDLAVKMLNPIQQASTVSEMTNAYSDALVSYDEAFTAIKAAGYSDYEAQLHLAIASVTKKNKITTLVESLAKTEYKEGSKSLNDSMSLLREYGVSEERIQLLTELWPLEVKHTVKILSESDLRTAYSLGLISADNFRAGLIQKNYDEWSADIIISLENTQLAPTRVGGIPAGITTTGAVKTFTKAELKALLVGGLMTASEWAYQMSLLGYSDEQITLYAQLILSKMTTTQTGG